MIILKATGSEACLNLLSILFRLFMSVYEFVFEALIDDFLVNPDLEGEVPADVWPAANS